MLKKEILSVSKSVNGESGMDAYVANALVGSYYKILIANVNTGEFKVFKNDGLLGEEGLDEVPDVYTYMQKIIDDKIVYPEYATACRRFTNPEYVRKSVFSGERRIVQSYRRRTNQGDKWITFAIIAPDDCSPENPIALFTWRNADSDAITLLDTLPTISSLYDKLIRINLSNNTYEPVVVDADDQDQLVGGVINMYEWWAGYSKDGNIAKEDMGAFSTLTRTGSLQKRFAEDPTPVNFRYRRKIGDEFRWVQLMIAPSVEYSEENQIMLLSLKDVHEEYTAQMRSRQELIDNMNRDALTKLFNRLKFNADVDELSKSDDSFFACMYIDVNGLHELNNHLGHEKGDDMLRGVACALKKFFPDERVYRIGGDEFVVMSTKMPKSEIEVSVDKVRRELLKENYEISVGIETGACGENVEKIVAAAELAMRNDKAAYYMRNGDRRRKRQMNEELEQMLVQKHDTECFLKIIADQFSSVFFVDIVHDTVRHIFIPDYVKMLLEESNNCFSAAMRLYVERFVKPEYHALFDTVLDYDKLDQELSENKSVEFVYQKADDTRMWLRILENDRQQSAKSETIWIFAEDNR